MVNTATPALTKPLATHVEQRAGAVADETGMNTWPDVGSTATECALFREWPKRGGKRPAEVRRWPASSREAAMRISIHVTVGNEDGSWRNQLRPHACSGRALPRSVRTTDLRKFNYPLRQMRTFDDSKLGGR